MRSLLFLMACGVAWGQSVTVGIPVFLGSGLNDATSGGAYVGASGNFNYVATVSSGGGGTNTVTYSKVRPIGPTTPTAAFSMVAGPNLLRYAAGSVSAASCTANRITFTAAGHPLTTGAMITVTGASPSGYNVTNSQVVVLSSSTFSVAVGSCPAAWTSGGTVVANDGVTITWASTTGHTATASWTVPVTATGSIQGTNFIQSGAGAMTTPPRNGENKQAEILSLRDFTAGDGVSVDTVGMTNAIQRARGSVVFIQANGARLYVPALGYNPDLTLKCYLIDQTIYWYAFLGVEFYGDGFQSCVKWVGGTTGPMMWFAGNYFPRVHDLHFIVNKSFPLNATANESMINITHGPLTGPNATSTFPTFEHVWLDCADGSVANGININGDNQGFMLDANNDFFLGRRINITGFKQAGIRMVGSQSFNHHIYDSVMSGQYFNSYPITSATWSGGVATFTVSGTINSNLVNQINISGVGLSGYNVSNALGTVTGASTFTVPIVSNPGGSSSGGNAGISSAGLYGVQALSQLVAIGSGSGSGASFSWHGGGITSSSYDFYIDGSSAQPIVLEGFNSESFGGMLLFAHTINGKVTVQHFRWAGGFLGTAGSDFIHQERGQLSVRNGWAGGQSYAAGNPPTGLTLYYLGGGTQAEEPKLELDSVDVITNYNTLATFLTGAGSQNFVSKHFFTWHSLDTVAQGWFDDGEPLSVTTASWSAAAGGTIRYTVDLPVINGTAPGYDSFTIANVTPSGYNGTCSPSAYISLTQFECAGTGADPGMYVDGGDVVGIGIPNSDISKYVKNLVATNMQVDNLTVRNPSPLLSGELLKVFQASVDVTEIAEFNLSSGGRRGTGAKVARVAIGFPQNSGAPFENILDTGSCDKGGVLVGQLFSSSEASFGLATRQGTGGCPGTQTVTPQFTCHTENFCGWEIKTFSDLRGSPVGGVSLVSDANSGRPGDSYTGGGGILALVMNDGGGWHTFYSPGYTPATAATMTTGAATGITVATTCTSTAVPSGGGTPTITCSSVVTDPTHSHTQQ